LFFFQGQNPLHGHVCSLKADRPPVGLRQQVPGPVGLQAAGPHEHAGRRGGQGPLHEHALRPRQSQPQHFHQVGFHFETLLHWTPLNGITLGQTITDPIN
jgi:hypothetical protein